MTRDKEDLYLDPLSFKKMVDRRCMITSEPEEGSRVVFKQTSTKGPYFMGDGDISFLCGNCDFVLARNVTEEQIQHQFHTPDGLGLVLQCPECNGFNEFGPDIG